MGYIYSKISKVILARNGGNVFELPSFLRKSLFERAARAGHEEQVKMVKEYKKQYSR